MWKEISNGTQRTRLGNLKTEFLLSPAPPFISISDFPPLERVALGRPLVRTRGRPSWKKKGEESWKVFVRGQRQILFSFPVFFWPGRRTAGSRRGTADLIEREREEMPHAGLLIAEMRLPATARVAFILICQLQATSVSQCNAR